MNDYFAGNLARERQADYLREIAHDELVAQARRAAESGHRAADRHPRSFLRRFVVAAGAGLVLTLGLIGPVAAAGGSGGCATFGAATVAGAQATDVAFGPFVAGYASSGPGVLSGIVAGEHAVMCVAH